MSDPFSEPKKKVVYLVEFLDNERGWLPSSECAPTLEQSDAEGQKKFLARGYLRRLGHETEWRVTPFVEENGLWKPLGGVSAVPESQTDEAQVLSECLVERDQTIRDVENRFREAFDLIESAFAHVSHGGPTRAEAEKWLADNRSMRVRLK